MVKFHKVHEEPAEPCLTVEILSLSVWVLDRFLHHIFIPAWFFLGSYQEPCTPQELLTVLG